MFLFCIAESTSFTTDLILRSFKHVQDSDIIPRFLAVFGPGVRISTSDRKVDRLRLLCFVVQY